MNIKKGIMIDVSRGQVPKIQTLKNLISYLSKYGLNFISLYMEHTFQYQKHPIIWKNSGAYLKKEIKEIISFCKKYKIEVIPAIQTLGHFEKILSHKEYADLAETTLYSSLSPANKKTYKLLDDMIEEISSTFESSYINIGGDEVWDFAAGKSMNYAKKHGDATKLFLKHIVEVKKITDKYNKKIMMWSDMFLKYPEDLKFLPEDIIILNWNYSGEDKLYFKKLIKQLDSNKNSQMICPGVSTWDTVFPELDTALKNINNFVDASYSYKKKITGYMITTWGDDGNFNFLGESFPGFLFFLEKLISNKNLNITSLRNRIINKFFGIKSDLNKLLMFFSGLYKKLGFEKNYIFFKTLWEEPFFNSLIYDEKFNVKKIERLYGKSITYLDVINNISPTKNKKFFDEIKYKIAFNVDILQRIIFSNEIKTLWHNAYSNMWNEKLVEKNLNDIITILINMKGNMKILKEKYEKLWLKNYKPEGLQYNLNKFEKILNIYTDKLKEVKSKLNSYKKIGGGLADINYSFIRVIKNMNGHPETII